MTAQASVKPYQIGFPPQMAEEGGYPQNPTEPVEIGRASLDPTKVFDPLYSIMKGSSPELYYQLLKQSGVGYTLVRKQFWVFSQPPVSYSGGMQVTHEVNHTIGYNETIMKSFTATLQVTVGASGFGLEAEAQAGLQMTQENTKQWTEEETTSDTISFTAQPPRTTLLAWVLVDNYELFRTLPAHPDELMTSVQIFSGYTEYDTFPPR